MLHGRYAPLPQTESCLTGALQAVEAAVSAAVADVEVRTQEEVAAASVAMKAAAEAQQLRELEDKVDALQAQLATTTDAQHTAEAALA